MIASKPQHLVYCNYPFGPIGGPGCICLKELKGKTVTEQRFSLPYWISNNGDGSASIRLEKSPQRAERQDELQSQSEGWGEPCNGEIEIILKDGKLYIEDSDYKTIDGKYQRVEFTYPIPLKGEQVEDDLSDLDEPEDEDYEGEDE